MIRIDRVTSWAVSHETLLFAQAKHQVMLGRRMQAMLSNGTKRSLVMYTGITTLGGLALASIVMQPAGVAFPRNLQHLRKGKR